MTHRVGFIVKTLSNQNLPSGLLMRMQKLLLVVVMLAMALSPQAAYAKKHQAVHHRRHHVAAAVDRTAEYADMVIDAETGRIIHETDSSGIRHPASLTKMMTLYLAFQALEAGRLELNDALPVSSLAASQAPSKLGLRPGQTIRAEDAILSLVTESANDMAVVLAEALGGTESNFAALMTKQARALGMSKTYFRNASGLPDPAQITTAHDMAVLGASLVNHFPDYYPYFSQESFVYQGVGHQNHNHLMSRYDGMDGIKTGYIRASGFNLVASAKRDGTRLVAAVFGGRTAVARDNRVAELLDDSFDAAGSGTQRTAALDGGAVLLPAKTRGLFAEMGLPKRDFADAEPAERFAMPRAKTVAAKAPVQKVAMRERVRRPSRAGGGAWGIQIGAYSDAAMGRRALSSLVRTIDLPERANPQVQKVRAGGTTMYRARLMSLDKQTAQNVCSYLTQRGKSCLTVEP